MSAALNRVDQCLAELQEAQAWDDAQWALLQTLQRKLDIGRRLHRAYTPDWTRAVEGPAADSSVYATMAALCLRARTAVQGVDETARGARWAWLNTGWHACDHLTEADPLLAKGLLVQLQQALDEELAGC